MTRPAFLLSALLYAVLVVAALLLGVFAPWQAVLAWSVAVIIDATLRLVMWSMGGGDKR